jgi:hypothetical protein
MATWLCLAGRHYKLHCAGYGGVLEKVDLGSLPVGKPRAVLFPAGEDE